MLLLAACTVCAKPLLVPEVVVDVQVVVPGRPHE